MKILAFTVLHYGAEYLRESILSVKNNVDAHLIAYTKTPSFGYSTDMVNPDSEDELKKICSEFDHIIWTDVTGIRQENQHRQTAIDYARENNYDIILVIDSDEFDIRKVLWEGEKIVNVNELCNFLVDEVAYFQCMNIIIKFDNVDKDFDYVPFMGFKKIIRLRSDAEGVVDIPEGCIDFSVNKCRNVTGWTGWAERMDFRNTGVNGI